MIEAIIIGAVILVAAFILALIIAGAIRGSKISKKEDIKEVKADKEEAKEEIKEPNKESMKVVIAQGESIVVGSEGRIPCGEYTMESADGAETFNVRIGRYVREYSNGTRVVLTENQKVTPVSTSIILR